MSVMSETDAEIKIEMTCACYPNEYVSGDFARKLERERDEARAERDILRLHAQREAEQHDRMVGELEKVYAERDEAREQNAKLREIHDKAITAFQKAERERDEAQERECAAIESWWEEHQRALREGQRVVELREQNAKLRDIAERAICELSCCAEEVWIANSLKQELRAELERVKEGAK